jgi:outer membrane protein
LDTDFRSQESERWTGRLSQPLFTGMAGISGLNRAQQLQVFREYELLLTQWQLVRDIYNSFYDTLKGKQLVEKWSESVKRLKRQQEIAEAWVKQELATRLRQMEIDAEFFNALSQLASARSNYAIGEARLKELLALEYVDSLEIEGSLQSASDVSCDTEEICLDQALRQRPEIKLGQLSIAMAREDAKGILSRNLPHASFDASLIDYHREFDDGLRPDEDFNYYTLAFNLNMRPFQGGKNIFGYRRQKLAVKRLENELRKTRASIVTEVKSRYQQLLEGQSLIESSARGLEVAREIYDFTDHSTKLGVTSLDDLLTAELRLTQAEINKINAEHSLLLGQVQLDYAVGEGL